MKKVFGFLMALVAVAFFSVSCRKVVRAEAIGIVDETTDSVMIVKIDGEKVMFDITGCSFTNGAVMYGDSVIIGYIGDLGEKRALAETCYLIVKPSPIVEAGLDTTKVLITRDADPEEVEEIDKMIEAAKTHQKK